MYTHHYDCIHLPYDHERMRRRHISSRLAAWCNSVEAFKTKDRVRTNELGRSSIGCLWSLDFCHGRVRGQM